jgi:hypothetical protein
MAEKKGALAVIPTYMFDDEESKARQKAYNDALERVQKSLDQRKSRFIDPRFAAAAEAFLTPTKTGSAFESFGTLAKKLRETQATEEEEERMIAAQQLEAAKLGVDLTARQKMMEQTGRLFSGQQPFTSPGAPSAPGAAPGAAPSTPEGRPRSAEEEVIIAQLRAKGADAPAILKALQEYRSGNLKITEGGKYEYDTDKFTPFEKGEPPVDQPIYFRNSDGTIGRQTYPVPRSIAVELNRLLKDGKYDEYYTLAELVVKGPLASKPTAPAAQPADVASPAGAPKAGSPSGQRLPSSSEQALSSESQKVFEAKKAEEAAKLESALPEKYQQALMMSNTARQTANLVAQSPYVYGQLRQPGIASALGRLIQEGIKAGTTSISLGGFEDAIRQANPKISQTDLDNLMTVAGNLAELELIYTNLYLRGGGQITEGEREIVRRVVGSPSLSPKFLILKSELLKTRSDQDIALYNAFQSAKEKNPSVRYAEWLNGQQARGILTQFDRRFKGLMGLVPSEGKQTQKAPPNAKPSQEQGVNVPEAIPSGGAVLGRRSI